MLIRYQPLSHLPAPVPRSVPLFHGSPVSSGIRRYLFIDRILPKWNQCGSKSAPLGPTHAGRSADFIHLYCTVTARLLHGVLQDFATRDKRYAAHRPGERSCNRQADSIVEFLRKNSDRATEYSGAVTQSARKRSRRKLDALDHPPEPEPEEEAEEEFTGWMTAST